MKIDNETVAKLAHLARLEFDEAEAVKIKSDLENILDMCEKLNKINTDNVEPLIYLTQNENVLRDDQIKPSLSKKATLQNAPKSDGDFFRVPKFIDQNK